MPISSNTVFELKTITTQLGFLLTVSTIKIRRIPSDERTCSICQDPYNNHIWKVGGNANRPVKLDCGHVFGIQCLAHLVFTSDFSNRCPLCRAQIISDYYELNPSRRNWEVAIPLLTLLTTLDRPLAALVEPESLALLNSDQKSQDLPPVPEKHMDRIMILYKEFLSQFCNTLPPVSDRDRALAAEFQVEELNGRITRIGELHQQLQDGNAQLAQAQELLIRARANAEVAAANGDLEQARELTQNMQKEFEKCSGDLKQAKRETKLLRRELLETEGGCKQRVTVTLLIRVLIAVICVHVWGQILTNRHELFDLTGNICIGLMGAVVVIAASRSESWTAAFETSVPPLVFLLFLGKANSS